MQNKSNYTLFSTSRMKRILKPEIKSPSAGMVSPLSRRTISPTWISYCNRIVRLIVRDDSAINPFDITKIKDNHQQQLKDKTANLDVDGGFFSSALDLDHLIVVLSAELSELLLLVVVIEGSDSHDESYGNKNSNT